MKPSSTLPWLNKPAPNLGNIGSAVGGAALNAVNPFASTAFKALSATPQSNSIVQPAVAQAATIPQQSPVAPPTPTYAPVNMPPVNNQNNFSLDTSNINSDHMVGNYTPATVSSYRNQLQSNFDAYHASQQPLQTALGAATQYSPQELDAQKAMVNFTNSYNAGTNNIYSRPEPLEFQQGQQAALTRDASLQQSALSSNLNYLENIRKNNIDAINSQIGLNQQNFENQNTALTTGQNYGLQATQVGIQQQTANQGRYDYQQITDPNTGFPVIQVTDKQTGLPAGTISPSSTAGQTIMQNINSQGGLNNTNTGSTSNNGNAIVQNTMQMMGAKQDMPVSQAISTLGINNIVNGLIGQEGGSPKGVVNNPGNILFVGQPGATSSGVLATDSGKPFASFSTPQAGVTAVANLVNGAAQKGANLSDFIASYKGVTNSTPQPQNNLDTQYQALINAAPIQIKNGVKQLPDGTPYIDSSQVPSQFATVANAYSARTGIRVLSSDDAKTIDSAKQAVANMAAQASLFSQLAPTGLGGKISNAFNRSIVGINDNNTGSMLKTYQDNRDNLLQQIRTLAGSSPRLNANELNLAANSMPQLNGVVGMDTLKDGINKLVLTQTYLDNAIRALDPNYVGTPISINGQYAIQGPDGKAYTFPTRDAAIQALQIKNQTK